jgi:hypothetical protein
VKLYTFQPLFVFDCLQELGYYHPFNVFEHDEFLRDEAIDEKKYGWSFLQSYRWLKEQMLQKGITYSANNDHMIWAWYQWAGTKMPKPDKRYKSVYNYFKDQPFVLLELEVDPKRVCLHDYDAWHGVLNYWMLAEEEEADRFKEKFNYYKEKPLSNLEAHKEIVESWQNIFDFEASKKILETTDENQYIQATFFELFYTDLTKVHFFENKRCTQVLKIKHKI